MIVYTIYGEEEVLSKPCMYCGIEKPLTEFGEHHRITDNKIILDNRCKTCKTKQTKHVIELKKTAPPKPEVCECCGKVPKTFNLDHDHESGEFRGWLCGPCNKSLGHFGDSVAGMLQALVYLIDRSGDMNIDQVIEFLDERR